jgi:hypothetical protein
MRFRCALPQSICRQNEVGATTSRVSCRCSNQVLLGAKEARMKAIGVDFHTPMANHCHAGRSNGSVGGEAMNARSHLVRDSNRRLPSRCGRRLRARNSERRTVRMREHQDVARRSQKEKSGSGFEALGNFEDSSDGVPVAAGAGGLQDFVHARPGKSGFALAIGKVNEQLVTDEVEFLRLNR